MTLVLINMRRKNKKEEPALRVPQPVAHINKARERKTTGKERKKTHPSLFFGVDLSWFARHGSVRSAQTIQNGHLFALTITVCRMRKYAHSHIMYTMYTYFHRPRASIQRARTYEGV